MADYERQAGNHVIEEENDQESIENPQKRPFTTGHQGHNGKRAASKNDNFYGSLTNERLPVVFPQSRPYSEKAVKPGRPTLKTNSYKPSERNSVTPKETEIEQPGRAGSVPMRYQPPAQAQGMLKTYIRVIPKNIPQDRERLYDEALHLKNNLHELRTENLRMKTRITFLERESIKVEKIMAQHQHENHLTGERESVPKAAESHLVVGLKNKVKELEATLHTKDTELTKIKRTLKYTKLHELEAEVKMFADENYRLKNILEHVVKDKIDHIVGRENRTMLQEECVLQNAHIQVLERDFKEAILTVNKLEEQNSELEKKIEDSEKKRSKESHRLKKLLNESEKEKTRLKTEASAATLQQSQNPIPIFPTGKKTVTGYTKEEFNIMELDKKKAENASLNEQLVEKNKYIQSLEKQLKEVARMSTERHSQHQTAERHSSKNTERTEKGATHNHRTEISMPSIVESKPQEEKTVTIIEPEKVPHKSVASTPPVEKAKEEVPEEPVVQKEEVKQKSGPRKRVQKVRVEDVKDLGYEMNLNLRTRGITFEQLNNEVWPERSLETGRISVKEVNEILRNDPFNVEKEEDSELIARYLVEENREEYLYFDEDVEGDVVIVKSILRKLIGNIPRWDHESAQNLIESISEICIKNYGSLRENLRVMCKSGYLDKRGLQEACKLIDVQLSENQMEFIITKLFERSNNLHKLSIEDLFIVFNQKPKYEERAPSVQSKDDRRSSKGSDREPVHHEPVVAQKKPDNLILVNDNKPKEIVIENVNKPKEPFSLPGTRENPNMLNLGGSGSSSRSRESEEKIRFEPEKKPEEKTVVVEKAPLKFESGQFESFGAKPKEVEKEVEVQEDNEGGSEIYEDNEKSEISDKEDPYEKFSERDEEEEETSKRSDKDQEEEEQENYAAEDKQEEEDEEEQEQKSEQKYDEDDYEDDNNEGHSHGNHNSLAPRSQAQDQDEVDSQGLGNSRNQLASQRTDHTNATQITEPKSEGYEAHKRTPMRAAPEENKVEEDDEEEEKEQEEQEEEQEEQDDKVDKEEEYEEEEAFEEEDDEEQENAKEKSAGSGNVLQKVKSEDYNDDDMSFEEEEEDVKKRNSSKGSDTKQVKGKAKVDDYDNDELDFEGEDDA